MEWKISMAIIILFQVARVSPAVIPEEYNSKLNNLYEKILSEIKEFSLILVNGKERLKSIVYTAKESLEIELEHLKQYMRETKVDAANENKTISNCLGEDIIDTIDISNIDICIQLPFTQHIESLNNDLSIKHKEFYSDINSCTEENTEKYTKRCLDNKIAEWERDLNSTKLLGTSLLDSAYQLSLRCTKISLTQIDKDIIFIARNFTSCVDAILEY
ncbi:uncharacterized protein [Diabrotica undecimpunctata]|uniref:uncharacterized protein n=1 Tax=Diabrotica undecimpunctata TaxID=50387 RepID=UPI003B640825